MSEVHGNKYRQGTKKATDRLSSRVPGTIIENSSSEKAVTSGTSSGVDAIKEDMANLTL